MVSLTKIHVSYELDDEPLIVKPGDKLSGKVIVKNKGKKDKKLKKLFVRLVEKYKQLEESTDSETGEKTTHWAKKKNTLQKLELAKKDKIDSGDKQEFKFDMTLPNWKRKKGKGKSDDKYDNWHLSLYFVQKTGMVASRGSDKKDATCILPVKGGMVAPSFGDPKEGKRLAKEAKKETKAELKAEKLVEAVKSDDETMFCSNCGKVIKASAKFCEHCGNKID